MNRLFPITFSMPSNKILDKIPTKTRLLSQLIPGKLNTYIYNNEDDYYKQYQESLFALTHKKGGWDCMRHYEIMANGCIPYFPNIEKCPKNTMALLPKDLILEGNTLYLKYKDKVSIENFTQDELEECFELINRFLIFTREQLTTTEIAKYILSKCKCRSAGTPMECPPEAGVWGPNPTCEKPVEKVLFLSQNSGPDYLRCLSLQGFKELFGINCHDYCRVPHIYKNFQNPRVLYGKGITYTNNIDETLRNDKLDDTIIENIKNKYYDIVIYGSIHRGMPFYDLVCDSYKPEEIIMLCGEDCDENSNKHTCVYQKFIDKGNFVFVREL
jgi:hypothetical protein